MQEAYSQTIFVEFRKGSRMAFGKIYNLFYCQVYYMVLRYGVEGEEAITITNESFSKLFSLHSNFESFDNIKAFLLVAAKNTSQDYLRQIRRDRTPER